MYIIENGVPDFHRWLKRGRKCWNYCLADSSDDCCSFNVGEKNNAGRFVWCRFCPPSVAIKIPEIERIVAKKVERYKATIIERATNPKVRKRTCRVCGNEFKTKRYHNPFPLCPECKKNVEVDDVIAVLGLKTLKRKGEKAIIKSENETSVFDNIEDAIEAFIEIARAEFLKREWEITERDEIERPCWG